MAQQGYLPLLQGLIFTHPWAGKAQPPPRQRQSRPMQRSHHSHGFSKILSHSTSKHQLCAATACPEQHQPTAAFPGGTKAAPLLFWTEPQNLMHQGCELQCLQGKNLTSEEVICMRDKVKRRGCVLQPPPAWPFHVSVTLGKHGQDVTMCHHVLALGALLYTPAQQAQIPSQPCGFTGSPVLGCGEQGWVATQGTPVPSSIAGGTHRDPGPL